MLRIKNAILGENGPAESLPTVTEGEPASQFPSLVTSSAPSQSESSLSQPVPHWLRELNRSRVARHSRASSIVSTRTKFSTTTLQEDARSIDINVAGQYFRISRDGSRITMDDPPPYAGPGETVRFGPRPSTVTDREVVGVGRHNEEDDISESKDEAMTPRSMIATTESDSLVRANILDPSEFEMPSPVGPDRLTHRSSSDTLVQFAMRDLSRNESRSSRTQAVEPASMQRSFFRPTVLGLNATPAPGRARATHSLPVTPTRGIALPALITSGLPSAPPKTSPHSLSLRTGLSGASRIRSAGPVLSRSANEYEPRSPDYIGHNAIGAFPAAHSSRAIQDSALLSTTTRTTIIGTGEGNSEFPGTPGPHTPLSMDTENDISMHYARMMRKLDYEQRKALHLKDKELAEMRIRLHEKDTVLRQQLRAKDFMIDDLKKRLSNFEENVEVMLEKARNQVEDLWECRWKDRDFHLRERMRRIEEEAQKAIERFRAGEAERQDGIHTSSGGAVNMQSSMK